MSDWCEKCARPLPDAEVIEKQAAEIEQYKQAVQLYDAALKEAHPRGASGRVFDLWNSARILLEREG